MIDYQRGAKLAGAGSWVYRGMGARMEWALLNFFVSEHLNDGYELVLPPHMLNYECGYVAGQFPKFTDEVYWIQNPTSTDKKFMLPTAETALVNPHRDEVLTSEEVWIPSMEIYKEVSSASNARDYQARRGNVKFRGEDKKLQFVHTLNASGLATSRVIPAIVEQYQNVDGSVTVPEVLRPFIGCEVIR